MWLAPCDGNPDAGSRDCCTGSQGVDRQKQCDQALGLRHGGPEDSRCQEALSWPRLWSGQPHCHKATPADLAQADLVAGGDRQGWGDFHRDIEADQGPGVGCCLTENGGRSPHSSKPIQDCFLSNNLSIQEESEYDMVMCATGRKVPLEGFERRSLEAQVGICMDLKEEVHKCTSRNDAMNAGG